MGITTWKPYKGKQSRWTRGALQGYHEAEDSAWHMWKQHAEAFAQPQDTTAAQ